MNETVNPKTYRELNDEVAKLMKVTGLSMEYIVTVLISSLKEVEGYAQANRISFAEATEHYRRLGKIEAFLNKLRGDATA